MNHSWSDGSIVNSYYCANVRTWIQIHINSVLWGEKTGLLRLAGCQPSARFNEIRSQRNTMDSVRAGYPTSSASMHVHTYLHTHIPHTTQFLDLPNSSKQTKQNKTWWILFSSYLNCFSTFLFLNGQIVFCKRQVDIFFPSRLVLSSQL